MAYSTLKRKTPLKSKAPLKSKTPLKSNGCFKPSCGFRKKESDDLSDDGEKSPSGARKAAKTPKRQTRSSLETHLDIVFSLYVRLRDAMPNGMVRCISCGRVFPFAQIQCGHYISRRNKLLRWDERNANGECVNCNCFDRTHLDNYRKNLIKKIGLKEVLNLESKRFDSTKFEKAEIEAKIKDFKKKALVLSKEKNISVKI